MIQNSRREFLRASALIGGGLLAANPVAFARAALAADTPTAMSIARWNEATLSTANLATMATRLTEAAIESMGGMTRFVSKGDVVWIKPNIGWNRRPELAANTNPNVVGTLVRLCREAGAKTVKVGDHSCHPAKQAYRTSGIAAAAKANDGQVVYLDKRRFVDTKLDGERLDTWPIYAEIMEADLVINVPVVKHHGLTGASVAMKNYMGVIGGQRNVWHQNMAPCLADITRFMQPQFTVIDAVRVLTAHGPQGGDPGDVQLRGVVAAGTDIVALDAFGVTLLGHEPQEVKTIKAAADRNLGTLDFQSLAPVESTLS